MVVIAGVLYYIIALALGGIVIAALYGKSLENNLHK